MMVIETNTHAWKNLRVNPDRLSRDFEALARIGNTGDGGVHRPAFSSDHLAARAWLCDRIQEAGLELSVDDAGNHSGRLSCGPHGALALLLGSHLDSVPNGGRFDGALGVIAGLEVLRTVKEAGLRLPFHLEVIDFSDEEGTLVGLLGSQALAGLLKPEDLQNPRGGRAELLKGLEQARLSEEGLLKAAREIGSLAGYLELHIEQGPRLAQSGVQIGVVTEIVGIRSYRLTFLGQADHAGTTPMRGRLDAAQGVAGFILALRQLVMEHYPDCMGNTGMLQLFPGAFNIVPARALLGLELRSADEEILSRLEDTVLKRAQAEAEKYSLGLEIEFLGRHAPAPMGKIPQEAIIDAANLLNLRYMEMTSGAGHDAQVLSTLCPSGMIFVPSVGGASHSGREFTEWQDCLNGANVLLHASLCFAKNGY